MAKKLIDKLLTAYENIWCIGGGAILLYFVLIFLFFLVKNEELRYFTLIILIVLGILLFLGARRWNAVNKKIGAYKKISKMEYDWWKKHRKGFLSLDYEDYIRLSNLPPEERDKEDIFKGADFSKVFEDIKRKKEQK